MTVTCTILPIDTGWRVQSRGFAWDFAQGPQAVEFANDMAEQLAHALGRPTSVRFQDEAGDSHELRSYEGGPPKPPAAYMAGALRQATVLPLRRQDH